MLAEEPMTFPVNDPSASVNGHATNGHAMPDARGADGREARHSAESVEHFTPPHFVEAARAVLGDVDLDPASSERAQTIVKASRAYYTAETNRAERTLGREWRGRVLLNPPGGKIDGEGECLRLVKGKAKGEGYERVADGKAPLGKPVSAAKAFWWKLIEEWRAGRVEAAVFVAFSLELLQSCQVEPASAEHVPSRFPLCIPSRRVAYWKAAPGGGFEEGKSPPHASCFVWLPPSKLRPYSLEWGPSRERFAAHFAPFGEILHGRWTA